MSAKNYTQKLIFIQSMVLLIFTTGADAQRGWGRPYRHGHTYYHGPWGVRPFVSLGFRGMNSRHHSRYFYRPFSGYYRAIAPPFGVRIAILPPGCHRIYAGPDSYYYYNGTYYSPSDRNDYKVVAPPLGAKVPELPKDAQAVVINGQKYYELDGTYYKEEIAVNNELWFTVVGINGELNTDNTSADNPKIGDRVAKLPADCKAVVISGKKYFEAPSGLYYEEIISPNKVEYEVVGNLDK